MDESPKNDQGSGALRTRTRVRMADKPKTVSFQQNKFVDKNQAGSPLKTKVSVDDLSPTSRRNPRALQSNRSLSGEHNLNDIDYQDDNMDGRTSPLRQPTSILKKKNSKDNLRDAKNKGGQLGAIYDQLVRVKKAHNVAKRLQSENEETLQFMKEMRLQAQKNQATMGGGVDKSSNVTSSQFTSPRA